jgi:hypothetical protein
VEGDNLSHIEGYLARSVAAFDAAAQDENFKRALFDISAILEAVEVARSIGVAMVGFIGKTGGKVAGAVDLCLHAPSDWTPLIQQIHIVAAHIICGLVEDAMFPEAAANYHGVRE